MYVAYNPFYPPDLAHIEARNASPDRSHNETWDSLVITGGIGFLAYMFLFGSFFYFGFKWIGLVSSRFEKIIFPILWVVGGFAGAIGGIMIRGPELVGVGIAAGVALGITIYLVISVLINSLGKQETTTHVNVSLRDQVLLISLVSAVMAHFIEIHTGIAIASTRSLFWAYAALLVIVGLGYVQDVKAVESLVIGVAQTISGVVKPGSVGAATSKPTAGATRRSRRQVQASSSLPVQRRQSATSFALPVWFSTVAVSGLFLGLIMGIMAFDFINNSERIAVPGQVFVNAFVTVRGQPALGVLGMLLLTWIVGSVLLIADTHRRGTLQVDEKENFKPLLAATVLVLVISALVCVAYGTFIAGRLVDFVSARQNTVDNILSIADQLAAFPAYLYVLIATVAIIAAFLLRGEEPMVPAKSYSVAGFSALFVFILTIWTISTSNLQPIAADIIYKQAAPWDQQGGTVLQAGTNVQGWDVAIEHYRRAIQLAPNEDFYYLWLGRALLEKAKSTQDTQTLKTWADDAPFTKVIDDGAVNWNRKPNTLPSSALSRDDLLTAAKIILTEARIINPLNTDHSANLARMWRQSGDIATDPIVKQARYEKSSQEYSTATTLSPKNAVLWNEWGSLYLYSFNDIDSAVLKLDKSLTLDDRFDQTYLLRGEMEMQQANKLDQQRQQAQQTLATIPVSDTSKFNEAQTNKNTADEAYKVKLRDAKIQFTSAISVNPAATQAYNVLTYIDQQLGDYASAISTTMTSIEKSPTDWNGYKNLALLYRDSNQVALAIPALQKAIELAPADQKAGLQGLLDQLSAVQK